MNVYVHVAVTQQLHRVRTARSEDPARSRRRSKLRQLRALLWLRRVRCMPACPNFFRASTSRRGTNVAIDAAHGPDQSGLGQAWSRLPNAEAARCYCTVSLTLYIQMSHGIRNAVRRRHGRQQPTERESQVSSLYVARCKPQCTSRVHHVRRPCRCTAVPPSHRLRCRARPSTFVSTSLATSASAEAEWWHACMQLGPW